MNTRFREIAPGVVVEMVATRIEMTYTPSTTGTPEGLTATWHAQEFLPVGGGFQRLGDRGERLHTVLADHAGTVIDAGVDPFTGQPILLSALGAVMWLKAWFNFQHNLEHGNPPWGHDAGDTENADLE